MPEARESWIRRAFDARVAPLEAFVRLRQLLAAHRATLALAVGVLGLLQAVLAGWLLTDAGRRIAARVLADVGTGRIPLPREGRVIGQLDALTVIVVLLALSGLACIVFRRKLVREGFWTPAYLLAAAYLLLKALHTRFRDAVIVEKVIPEPYAYRILMPESIRFAGQFCRLEDCNLVLMYAANYACLVAFLYAMRHLLRTFFDLREIYVRAFPLFTAVFLVPFYHHWHHYIYDFPLLLLTALMVIFLYKERWLAFYLCFVLACFNKETTILMTAVFGVYQLHRRERIGVVALHVGAQVVIFAAIFLYIRLLTADHPGGPFEFHLYRNLDMFTHRQEMETILAWTALAALVFHRWSEKPFLLRCGLIPLGVLLPIILVAGWFEELRDYLEAVPFLLPLAWASFCAGLESLAAPRVRGGRSRRDAAHTA